jgi:hypothetical protein
MTRRIAPLKSLRGSVLCRRDSPVNTVRETIGWWEARRIPFNLIVGGAGVLTCIVVVIVGLGAEILFNSEFGLPDPPGFAVVGIVLYAIVANLFFTAGWLAELAIRKIWPHEADRFATLTLSLGLIFSVLLTLSPGIVVAVAGGFKLVRHLRGIQN